MSNSGDQHGGVAKDERDVVREPRQVDASVAAATLPPEQRMLYNGGRGALNNLTEPHPHTRNPGFVLPSDALGLGTGFGEELQNEAHLSGAIRRKRSNTSLAGIGREAPESKRSIRRAISASQAASAPGSGSSSVPAPHYQASGVRASGVDLEAELALLGKGCLT
jgi:hypothetical protein